MAKKRSSHSAAGSGHLPTRNEILDFIANANTKVGKREIARAFDITGNDKIALKALLKEMAADGQLAGGRRRMRGVGRLAGTAVIELAGRDADGEIYGEPVDWDEESDGPRPRILLGPAKRRLDFTPGVGDRVLAHIEPLAGGDGYSHVAEPIKKLAREQARLLGIFRRTERGGGVILPVDRKHLKEWRVERADDGDAENGELVRFDLARQGRAGLTGARVVERLGNPADERKISLIAIHAHGIPDTFPKSVLDALDALPVLDKGKREDLTGLPLVTIDPADARDHDDAVHAEPDTDPANPGGHIVTVAIADVAYYVRPGSALDREALKRGNSVYFPNRVVPMLPELISNDLCSLREKELRPCLAVRMVFDKDGHKRRHSFSRALMRSAAKLAYPEAQAAIDGKPSERAGPLLETVLRPLWAAYAALSKARDARGPLDLDLPERKVIVAEDGRIARIMVPERLDAHRLIEEMMIQANVAAAETLEAKKTPLVYRVHEEPSKEKMTSLRDFLVTLDLPLPKAEVLRPLHFNRLLAKAKGTATAELVNEVVLRSQAQAVYSPDNLGHFGLNLKKYAHFTSPIRRYADLVVHRALVRALGLGPGGLEDSEITRLEETAVQVSEAERRAMAAERETTDRMIASYLADRVGATFRGKIAGVTRSGLFVKLDDTGADGFVAISTLGQEFYAFDEGHRALVGERTGETFQLGDRLEVRLVEAVPSAGALRFEVISDGKKGLAAAAGRPLGKRGMRRRGGRRS